MMLARGVFQAKLFRQKHSNLVCAKNVLMDGLGSSVTLKSVMKKQPRNQQMDQQPAQLLSLHHVRRQGDLMDDEQWFRLCHRYDPHEQQVQQV